MRFKRDRKDMKRLKTAGLAGRLGGLLFILLSAVALATTNASAQTLATLHSFNGGNDGANPFAGLIADASGNLYGTAYSGGASSDGTVFEVTPSGTETVLHSFAGSFPSGSDGAEATGGLIADSSGNLYGTTEIGGASNDGTVFKLSGSGFVPPVHFAGVPGTPNCHGMSISTLAHTYGGMAAAAKALRYSSVAALQNAVTGYCGGS